MPSRIFRIDINEFFDFGLNIGWGDVYRWQRPGQYVDFPLSVLVRSDAKGLLSIKALQIYDNNKVVRWIGAPGSDTPAPRVLASVRQRRRKAPSKPRRPGTPRRRSSSPR